MTPVNKLGILVIVLMLLSIAGLTAYGAYTDRRNKFVVGDCVEQVYETEFYRDVYYHRINKVGEKAYLTSVKAENSKYFHSKANLEWKFTLNKFNKVDVMYCNVEKETLYDAAKR